MVPARLFVPQEVLEGWLSAGRVHMVGETLFVEGHPFELESALHFVTEVAGGGDEQKLVGRVKSAAQIDELGGEHVSASVVLGDNAYEVVEGFLAKAERGARKATHEQLLELFAKR